MRGFFGSIADVVQTKADITYGGLELWQYLNGATPAKSGATVNVQTALQVTTVLGCVRRIAEALMVPRKIYLKDPNTGARRQAPDHPLYDIVSVAPNSLQSGLEYFETIALHVALTFNHYSFISRVNGKIDELIPIEPGRVQAKLGKDYVMKYCVKLLDDTYADFSADEIWHIRGPSWNGAIGMDAIKLMREAIGLAIVTEETHARFHSNGAQPGGLISTDNKMDGPARERLKEMWSATQSGVANKFKTLVLDNGMKFEPMMMSGVDSEHVKTRQMQIEQICTGFGVMPIMIGYSGDKAPTFASAEQMFLAHLVHTVRPTQNRVSESLLRWLLTPKERAQGYYMGFVSADFLSPDMKSKAEYNKIALGGGGNPGWRTPDQVRGDDEEGPLPGGNRLYVPVNVTPIGDDGFPMPIAQAPTPVKKPGAP